MKSLTTITKDLNKNRGRVKEIIKILHKYHLTGWLNNVKHAGLVSFIKKDKAPSDFSELPVGVRMRMAFSEIGTTFIKLGQILSSRPDLIGEEACEELAKLQSDAPTDDASYVDSILKTLSVDDIASFDKTPLASGSIAQAHTATHADGTELIIKIMHDGIGFKISSDLEILDALASLAEHFDTPLKAYNPSMLVASFSESLRGELDFNSEVKNIQTFRQNFKGSDDVIFPKPYPELSSESVITMERFEGETLSRLNYDTVEREEKERLSYVIADTFFEMVFIHQFYHADPHAGNLIYQSNKQVGIIDCGMVGVLSPQEAQAIEDLMVTIVDQDTHTFCRIVINMGFTPKDLDEDAFERDVDHLIQKYFMESLDKLNMKSIVTDFNDILYSHRIVLSPSISMLFRLLVILEGTTQKFNVKFSIISLLKKYYFQIRIKRLDPRYIYAKSKKKILELGHIAEEVPQLLLKFIKRLERDDFSINMRHHNLNEGIDKLVLAMLSSSIIIGSMVLISARVKPLVGDISVLGILGLVCASPFIYKTLRRLK